MVLEEPRVEMATYYLGIKTFRILAGSKPF
jgi:hypothetical protein